MLQLWQPLKRLPARRIAGRLAAALRRWWLSDSVNCAGLPPVRSRSHYG